MTRSPGATRSGFIRPSPVGPFEEKYETPEVCGEHDVDPTVRASAALPGSLMVMSKPSRMGRPAGSRAYPNPVLPAAMTTTTPVCTSRSTSVQTGVRPAANQLGSNGWPTEMLTPCTCRSRPLSLSSWM